MNNRLFTILIFLMPFVLSEKLFALASRDTIVKQPLLINKAFRNPIGDYTASFKDALVYIQKDDMKRGIPLLTKAVEQIFYETNNNRALPYLFHEVFDLILLTNKINLSKKDRQLGEALVSAMFKTNKPSTDYLKQLIKKSPKTVYAQRFEIFIDVITNNNDIDDHVDGFLKRNPDVASVNMLKAERLNTKENYKECINYCNHVIALTPQYAYAYKLRADCYSEIKQNENALADLNKAITLYPQFFDAVYSRADVLYDLRMYDKAITGYKTIFNLNPGYKWSAYNLARAYTKTNVLDSALYFANENIKLNPDDGDGYDVKGNIYYSKEDYATAITFYDQAISDTAKAYYFEDRGNAYYYKGDKNSAKKDFIKATEIDTLSAYAYRRLGNCYYDEKDFEKAIWCQNKSLKIEPNEREAWVSLNLIYNGLNNLPEAISAGIKAVEADSTYYLSTGNLGWSYYLSGKYDDCIKYSYQALKYKKDATFAMFNIALATLRKGQFEKAKILYANFLKECKQNNYTINDGALVDLQDLVDKKIMVAESKFIIKDIWHK